MNFPSLGMAGSGLRGDDLMKVYPEQTINDFAYGDIIETAAEGINVVKGAKLLVINRDQQNVTDFPLLVEAEESISEWCLPAGTFFRVANKHTPLYMVMSNSHVFNLTEKQMHTTNSLRFEDKQLVEANVSLTEVL